MIQVSDLTFQSLARNQTGIMIFFQISITIGELKAVVDKRRPSNNEGSDTIISNAKTV